MKVIVDLTKKTLKVIENERSIFRGEYGADKLTLLINKQLVNEYPTITALLSNGRKIGAYTTDDVYGNEVIDGVTYTTANFTLSKENGFTLSEGKMQVTIWMNSDGKKEAIGNLLLNVVNTTAFDDENIIISDDVTGAVVNMREEINNAVSQVNLNGLAVNNLDIKVKNFKDLGAIDTLDELNEVKANGVYTFEQDDMQHLMLVCDLGDTGNYIKQYIIHGNVPTGATLITRNYTNSNGWTKTTEIFANKNDIELLSTKVNSFTDLGVVGNPMMEPATWLNEITTAGTYTMNFSGVQLLMLVSNTAVGITQIIFFDYPNSADNIDYRIRTSKDGINWTYTDDYFVKGQQLTEYSNSVQNSFNALYIAVTDIQDTKADITYVNNKFNQILGTGASETLDTIGEIAQALRNNADVIDTLATKGQVKEIENTINALNLYDFTYSVNAYVEDGVLVLDDMSAYVDGTTLVLRNGSVVDDTLEL